MPLMCLVLHDRGRYFYLFICTVLSALLGGDGYRGFLCPRERTITAASVCFGRHRRVRGGEGGAGSGGVRQDLPSRSYTLLPLTLPIINNASVVESGQ